MKRIAGTVILVLTLLIIAFMMYAIIGLVLGF